MSAKVGYGSPPLHSRFQKGKSGNKAGRPPNPKASSISALIDDVMHEPIRYSEDGRRMVSAKKEYLIKRLIRDALQGDYRAAALLMEIHAQGLSAASDGRVKVIIEGWSRDYPEQTGIEKTEKYRAQRYSLSGTGPLPAEGQLSPKQNDGIDNE